MGTFQEGADPGALKKQRALPEFEREDAVQSDVLVVGVSGSVGMMNVQTFLRLIGFAMLLAAAGCELDANLQGTKLPTASLSIPARTAAAAGPILPLGVEPLEGAEPPVFVVRGGSLGQGRLVLLHGMCGHGLGYAQSFQRASAKKGVLIAPQADVVCGEGPWAKWSLNVAALDGRITDAFRKLGDDGPIEDVCVLGVSQGATRAAALARTFPDRYTRLVSIGAPTVVKTAGLERLRGAVLMVGERERKDLMLASEQALRKLGVPSKSVVIPGADHASMGDTPEQTMGATLDWLWEASRPTRGSSGPPSIR